MKHHEKHDKHEKKAHHKKGGKVADHVNDDEEEPLKKGGTAHKAHKAHGEMPKKRADKRARGGAMTPKAPLSGAKPSTMRPGFSEKMKVDKDDN